MVKTRALKTFSIKSYRPFTFWSLFLQKFSFFICPKFWDRRPTFFLCADGNQYRYVYAVPAGEIAARVQIRNFSYQHETQTPEIKWWDGVRQSSAQEYIDSNDGWQRPPTHCSTGNPHAGTDVVYKLIVTTNTNWHVAVSTCQSFGDGVTLARIFCDEEQDFLRNLAVYSSRGSQPAWLGGTQDSQGNWVWVNSDGSNGILIESQGGWNIDWNSGQPDNSGGNEDCMEINRFPDNYGTSKYLNDIACGTSNLHSVGNFICEKRFGV